MIIAQISDLHVSASDRRDNAGSMLARLERVLEALRALRPAPDLVLATGDLAEHGAAEEYAILRSLWSALPMPVYVMPGNHDDRAVLIAAFAGDGYLAADARFAQYAVDRHPLRLVALDTLVPGREGGDLCAERLGWLEATLTAAPERPTLLAMHHPPCATGISYMDAMGLAGVAATRLRAIVERNAQVVGIVCGHVHRPAHVPWAGRVVSVCPSTAWLGVLDLRPDGRDEATAEAPAFQVHAWRGGVLATHVVYAPQR